MSKVTQRPPLDLEIIKVRSRNNFHVPGYPHRDLDALIGEVEYLREQRQATKPRAKSPNQAVETPWEFIHWAEKRFGRFIQDLACTPENAKADHGIMPEMDSLKVPWPTVPEGFHSWLNPPFANIQPWAAKCAANREARVLMLVPAAVGSHWYAQHVVGQARAAYALNPRIRFTDGPYPKDLMLVDYSPGEWTGLQQVVWKDTGRGRRA